MSELAVNIVIPTYNRASCLERAIEAALAQTHANTAVTVIDDGSIDDTPSITRRYASESRFACIRLGKNIGTAQAKNLGILACRCDAISFHDSDDIPDRNKILLQTRALDLQGHRADDILNWAPLGHEPNCALTVDIAVGGYELVKLDGSVHYINKQVSLVDDFFPNLQFPAKTEGDWCLVNCGLFHRRVFERLGGFIDSIEEDRELRNRTIAAGCIYYFIDRPLLTKIEMHDSLTVQSDTGYAAERRRRDRLEVWRRIATYRSGTLGERVATEQCAEIDLSDIVIEELINEHRFTRSEAIPATPATRAALRALEQRATPQRPAGAIGNG